MASFGETLRRERELRGISLREIADTTKISLRFLQALEADRIDVLPGGLFRKTFVRQYAKHVGLDPERMVAEFLYAHGDGPEAGPAAAGRKGRALPQGAFTALAVVALLVWLAYPRGSDREEAASAATPAPPSSLAREYVYPPAAPAPAVTEAAVAAPRSSLDELTLTLTAEQDCWVQVDVDGESVLNRVLAAGESETIAASGEIVLSVGNAGGVRFRVNDRPGVPLGRAGEVKKNIVITRQSLPSLVRPDPPSDPPPSG